MQSDRRTADLTRLFLPPSCFAAPSVYDTSCNFTFLHRGYLSACCVKNKTSKTATTARMEKNPRNRVHEKHRFEYWCSEIKQQRRSIQSSWNSCTKIHAATSKQVNSKAKEATQGRVEFRYKSLKWVQIAPESKKVYTNLKRKINKCHALTRHSLRLTAGNTSEMYNSPSLAISLTISAPQKKKNQSLHLDWSTQLLTKWRICSF